MDQWGGDTEPGVRVMAMENRLYRRILGGHLVDFMGALQPDESWARVMRSGGAGNRAYVLLAEPFHDGCKDYNDYREYRLARLSAYVEVSRLRVDTAKTVIGLAFDVPTKDRPGGSEDLFCTFVPEFTRECREHAEQVQREFGLLLPEKTAMQERKYQEFPDVSGERNRPAPVYF